MKILCASMSGAGHAHPMASVARALVARGHDVTFSSGANHAEDAARAGAAFVELPVSRGSPREALEPYDDAEDMARLMAPMVSSLAPDVVVADLITLGPALAAEVCGIPHATLCIHGLHTPSRDLPPFGVGRPPGRGIARIGDAWMRKGQMRDLTRARDALNVARAKLGLPMVSRLDAQLSGELILVATLPSLELPRSDWPARAHVIGPCLWDARGDVPALPPGDAPLVLVAATTAHDERRILRAALGAISALGVRGVITTGGATVRVDPPPGVVVVPFASHDAVLPHCAAVVCSGGHGIVARALSAGVPLLVVPGPGDQFENGYRVQRSGAGLRARPRAVARALRRILTEPAFGQSAARIKAEAAGMNGPVRAAELVEALGARRLIDLHE